MTPEISPLHVESTGQITRVRLLLPEFLHADVIEAAGEMLSSLVEDEGRRVLVLDFTGVNKVCSAFLGRIIALHKRLLTLQGRLVLCGLDPEVRRVFDLCQLSRILHFCPDEAAAIQALSPSSV